MTPRVLSIAGSDPSGGAGIQADLKTFSAYRVYGMTAITGITVQNTVGVSRVVMADPALVREQIMAAVEDIGVDAIKIGMLGDAAVVRVVSRLLPALSGIPVVVDPVMRATSGDRLLDENAERVFVEELVPQATVITPNLPEAEALVGFSVRDRKAMMRAAQAIASRGTAHVLIKGGHLAEEDASDLLLQAGKEVWFSRPRIETRNTHGTGCTLSSAIAAGLALGWPLEQSVGRAKDFVSQAILQAPGLGRGHGPLWHHYQGNE